MDGSFSLLADEYFAELESSKKTIIMTSHNPALLRKYCHRALWLESGIIRMDGAAGDVLDQYETSTSAETRNRLELYEDAGSSSSK